MWFVCHNGFHVRDNTWILPPYLFWVVFAVILNLTNGRGQRVTVDQALSFDNEAIDVGARVGNDALERIATSG